MTPAHEIAIRLLIERRAFPPGSLDWNYRTRAAWKLDQMARGIPSQDWTDEPPQGLTAPCKIDPERMEIAA